MLPRRLVLGGRRRAGCVSLSAVVPGARGGGGCCARSSCEQTPNETRLPRMSVTEEPKVSTSKVGGGGDDEEKAPLAVVVNTENTQFSAGVLGGIAGERLSLS